VRNLNTKDQHVGHVKVGEASKVVGVARLAKLLKHATGIWAGLERNRDRRDARKTGR
jgi:hypothetical protein